MHFSLHFCFTIKPQKKILYTLLTFFAQTIHGIEKLVKIWQLFHIAQTSFKGPNIVKNDFCFATSVYNNCLGHWNEENKKTNKNIKLNSWSFSLTFVKLLLTWMLYFPGFELATYKSWFMDWLSLFVDQIYPFFGKICESNLSFY